jgi:hypothetical protein
MMLSSGAEQLSHPAGGLLANDQEEVQSWFVTQGFREFSEKLPTLSDPGTGIGDQFLTLVNRRQDDPGMTLGARMHEVTDGTTD